MNLPDYNPEGRCPKCGYDTVTTKYVGKTQIPSPAEVTQRRYNIERYRAEEIRAGRKPHVQEEIEIKVVVVPEHLLRECVRCSFKWSEDVVGVKEIDVRSEAE